MLQELSVSAIVLDTVATNAPFTNNLTVDPSLVAATYVQQFNGTGSGDVMKAEPALKIWSLFEGLIEKSMALDRAPIPLSGKESNMALSIDFVAVG